MIIVLTWIAVLVGVVAIYLHKVYSSFKNNGIKHDTPIPLLGNMAKVLFRRNHIGFELLNLYNKYPEERFVGRYEFFKELVIIRDLDLIKQMTIKDFEYFLDHRSIFTESGSYLSRNLISMQGWGVHPKHLRRLYIALIRVRIDYSSFLYANSANTHLAKLDKVQNQALRIIGGFIRTTPIHSMECELCIPNLSLRRKYLATKYCLKAQTLKNSNTIGVLNSLANYCNGRYWQNKKLPLLVTVYNCTKNEMISKSFPLEMFSLDTWVSNINTEKVIRDHLDEISLSKDSYELNYLKYSVLREISSKYSGWLKVYTDGSKKDGICGAAFYDSNNDYGNMFKIMNSDLCVMTAELVAISEALGYIQATSGNSRNVVFVDSRSALQHIARCASGYRGVSIAYVIIKQILHFTTNNSELILQWIPSHVGLPGNEKVDWLAKKALLEGSSLNILSSDFELLSKYKV